MKKQVLVQQNICDLCGKDDSFKQCLGCSIDICYDCEESKAVVYNYGCFSSGSYNGLYCNSCVVRLTAKPDRLFSQYLFVKELRLQYDNFYNQTVEQSKLSEDIIKEILSKLKGHHNDN
jgi:hypothetical protein